MADDALPVERVLQVAQRGVVVDVWDVLLVREDDGLRHRDPELARQRALEELLVRLPPEGVVDDRGAHQGRALQMRSVVGDLMRDAVDDHSVPGLLQLPRPTEDGELGRNSFGGAPLVDHVDERPREGVLASDQNPDDLVFAHRPYLPVTRLRWPGTCASFPTSRANREPIRPKYRARRRPLSI